MGAAGWRTLGKRSEGGGKALRVTWPTADRRSQCMFLLMHRVGDLLRFPCARRELIPYYAMQALPTCCSPPGTPLPSRKLNKHAITLVVSARHTMGASTDISP